MLTPLSPDINLERLQLHLCACSERLLHITNTIEAELRKPHKDLEWRLLAFLHKERAVYSFALWLLQDIQNPAGEGETSCSGGSGNGRVDAADRLIPASDRQPV
jgi:hypothetical protein